MKICQITSVIPPYKDGVGSAALKIHKLLHENNLSSIILTSTNQKVGYGILNVIEEWKVKKLFNLIREQHTLGYDKIILHFPTPYLINNHSIFLLSFMLFLSGINLIVYLHEFAIYKLLGKIKIYLLLLFTKKIITTDSLNYYQLKKLPFLKGKVFKLPTGSNFLVEQNNSVINQNEKVCIAFWGYIMRGKGIQKFLDFVERFNRDDVEFYLIGDVPESASKIDYELKQNVLACNKINFLGYLVDDELINRLKGIDIVILPYEDGLTERRGSFMLSMQLGKVVVTTKPKIEIEGLVDNFNIIFFENTDELIQIMNKLLEEKKKLETISNNARKWYNEYHSDKIFINKFLKIIEIN